MREAMRLKERLCGHLVQAELVLNKTKLKSLEMDT
jgi:hypothetical protein